MTRKLLMITLYILIGWQARAEIILAPMTLRAPASAAIAKQKLPQLKNICTLHAGDVGKLRFKGQSYEQAFSRVTDECFKKRSQLFVKKYNHQPDQDRQIQFAESCVNSIKCI